MAKLRILMIVMLVNVLATSMVFVSPRIVSAASSTVYVTPSTLASTGWKTQDLTCTNSALTGSSTFVNGPGVPLRGGGSVQLAVGSNPNSYHVVGSDGYANVLLSQLSALSYSLYVVQADAAGQAPYLSILVDFNDGGTTTDDVLYFDPIYQSGSYAGAAPQNNGQVRYQEWQTWDVKNGAIRSRNFGVAGDVPSYTLATYAAAHPTARVTNEAARSGIRIIAGCAGSSTNLVVGVDNVTVGVGNDTTTFDFELGTDLAINKIAQPDPVQAGSNVSYNITLINSGPGNAPATIVTDALPAGTTFVSCVASAGGVCGGSGNDRTITFASLTAGTAATILLVASVNSTVADGTTLTNTASVSSSTLDTNSANNSFTASVVVRNSSSPSASPIGSPSASPSASPSPAPPVFSDVPPGAFGYDEIGQLARRGITTGCAPGEFCPNRPVTRAEMAAFIIRAVTGQTAAPAGPATPTFADVPTTHPQYGYIEALFARGITTGCGDPNATPRLYCPNDNVLRAEMAAFIIRALTGQTAAPAGPATPTFSDVPITQAQYGYIEELFRLKITTGCGDPNARPRTYCPGDNVTRAEMAVFIIRAYPAP